MPSSLALFSLEIPLCQFWNLLSSVPYMNYFCEWKSPISEAKQLVWPHTLTYPRLHLKKKNPLYFQTTDIFARWKTNSTFCQVFPDHTAA